MPHDELTDALLSKYRQTAFALEQGCNITPETLASYHGQTGMILLSVLEGMWSEKQLQKAIQDQMDDKCKTCVKHADGFSGSWIDLFKANFRFLAGCATVIICTAIAFNKLEQLKDFVRQARQPAAVSSVIDVDSETARGDS